MEGAKLEDERTKAIQSLIVQYNCFDKTMGSFANIPGFVFQKVNLHVESASAAATTTRLAIDRGIMTLQGDEDSDRFQIQVISRDGLHIVHLPFEHFKAVEASVVSYPNGRMIKGKTVFKISPAVLVNCIHSSTITIKISLKDHNTLHEALIRKK